MRNNFNKLINRLRERIREKNGISLNFMQLKIQRYYLRLTDIIRLIIYITFGVKWATWTNIVDESQSFQNCNYTN